MTDLVFGNVKHPAFKDRPITKAAGHGQDDLGQRTVKGVTWHRMLGSLWGTDTYFRGADVNSLTDYGVGVAAQDGEDHAGEILCWNDPLGRQSGWASGTYSAAAYGDGAAFVAKYGINAINRDRASIEISGFQNTPLDEKSRNAVAALTAYWADQAEIPWDVFPIVPQDGFSFVAWHEEFGPDNGQKKCPFDEVKEETPDLIERTRAILKAAQTSGKPAPATIQPYEIWWDRGDVGVQTNTDGTKVLGLVGEVTAKRDVILRQSATAKGVEVHRLKQGEKAVLVGTYRAANKQKWAFIEITPGRYGRAPLSAFTPVFPTL